MRVAEEAFRDSLKWWWQIHWIRLSNGYWTFPRHEQTS